MKELVFRIFMVVYILWMYTCTCNSKCDEFSCFIFKGHMHHKDLMVGRNSHFDTKNTHLKSIKGIGDGSQRYVACT